MAVPKIFEPHSAKQDEAIFSEHPITAVCTGIQWGKTRCGALWTKNRIHQYPQEENNFLITAPTYKILNQSTLPAFLELMEGCGQLKRTDSIFKVDNGPTIYFRTATEPDSIVGMTNVRGIWGDEAGKYPMYFWENLQGRASFKESPIILTTSPYATNWFYTELVRKKRSDVLLIQAKSSDNPYFPQDEFERRKRTMDPRRFAMLYGGEFLRMQGLVYPDFCEENMVEPCSLPLGTEYFAGIDWGYTEPFVLVVRAVTPDGRHYQVSEFFKSGTTITDQIQVARSKRQQFGIKAFYAGPDQPGSIEEFNRAGLPARPANNDVRRGIDAHTELIRTRAYKIFEGTSPNTLDEYETYHYPEPDDLSPDQSSKEQNPVGQNDHAMDANRYVTIETFRQATRELPKTPHVPGHEQRSRLRMRNKRAERWS